MRTTEGQGRVEDPPSPPPQPPPFLCSTLALFSRFLQDGGNCSLENWEAEGRVIQVPPSFPSCDSWIIYVLWLGCGHPMGYSALLPSSCPYSRLGPRIPLFPLEEWTCRRGSAELNSVG